MQRAANPLFAQALQGAHGAGDAWTCAAERLKSRAALTNWTAELETLEFLLIIATFAFILFWYVDNHVRGGEGALGLLGFVAPQPVVDPARKKSYRIKKRIAHRGRDLAALAENDGAAPSYQAAAAAHMRRRFRAQDEARYRAKDRADARYREKKTGDLFRVNP